MENMQDEKVSIPNLAMHYGAILGLFWAFKHMVAAGSDHVQVLIYLFYLLNAGTFLLVYIYYFKFRDIVPGKMQSASRCILFIIALFFFASFFEAAIMYLHFQFIDPTYFSSKIEPILIGMVNSFPYPQEAKDSMMNICTSKIFYIAMGFVGNLMLGGIIGSVLSLIIGNKKKNSL